MKSNWRNWSNVMKLSYLVSSTYRWISKRCFPVFGNVFKQLRHLAACFPLMRTFSYPCQFSCIGLPPVDDGFDGFDFTALFLCISRFFFTEVSIHFVKYVKWKKLKARVEFGVTHNKSLKCQSMWTLHSREK